MTHSPLFFILLRYCVGVLGVGYTTITVGYLRVFMTEYLRDGTQTRPEMMNGRILSFGGSIIEILSEKGVRVIARVTGKTPNKPSNSFE